MVSASSSGALFGIQSDFPYAYVDPVTQGGRRAGVDPAGFLAGEDQRDRVRRWRACAGALDRDAEPVCGGAHLDLP